MRLTDLYNTYKSETDQTKKAIIKSVYIYNGGKKLELNDNLDLTMYKAVCGLGIVKKLIENSHKKNNIISSMVQTKYKVEDIARILIKSMAPEYISIEKLEVGDNGNSFVIRFKGCSKLTGKCYDNRFIMETPDNKADCLKNFIQVENQLAMQLFEIMSYTNLVETINIVNSHMMYINVK